MPERPPPPPPRPTVGVVITASNYAHFLRDAIESALGQTRPADEIVVISDDASDDSASVVAGCPGVRLVGTPHQSLAAARNTGLREVNTDKLIFLAADDRLLPNAIAAGLACFAAAPGCGFVYGGYRQITLNGRMRSEDCYHPIGPQPYRDFLKGNVIGNQAAVMYDRAQLLAIGGFDPAVRHCDDYDVYLRLSRTTRIASHPETVAQSRWHGEHVAGVSERLRWALRVHHRQAGSARENAETARDWSLGRSRWRMLYVGGTLADAAREWRRRRSLPSAAREIVRAMGVAPFVTARHALRAVTRRFTQDRSAASGDAFGPARNRRRSPRLGSVDIGDLDRTTPISANFGFDRGRPVDRYYIEAFLERHAADIAGRVLEVADDSYCRRFGGSRITRQDILSLSPDNPLATIVGDLCAAQTLPAGQFDCLVLTQTLHLIFDLRAAVAQICRALKPGGIVLVTVPGISQIDRGATRDLWCWSLTPESAFRLFAEVFGGENVSVESHGNVYAATMFLHGLAVEELDTTKLDAADSSYPVIVTVRARKGAGTFVHH